MATIDGAETTVSIPRGAAIPAPRPDCPAEKNGAGVNKQTPVRMPSGRRIRSMTPTMSAVLFMMSPRARYGRIAVLQSPLPTVESDRAAGFRDRDFGTYLVH
jgi:hypothetical protein